MKNDKGRVLSEEEQAKENVYIKFEDFANHNAFDLLEKYSSSHLVFNDDIQGTTSMVLEGLLASLKLVRGSLADHTFLLLGAREAGTGIAELIAREISKQYLVKWASPRLHSGVPIEERHLQFHRPLLHCMKIKKKN
ncbi:hypothetical protein AHAS_Ahas11G0091400 [Arachis hypogaea]